MARAVIGCLLLLVIAPLVTAEEDERKEELRARVAEEVGEHIGDPAYLFDMLISKEEVIEYRERQLKDSNSLLEVVKKTFKDSTDFVNQKVCRVSTP